MSNKLTTLRDAIWEALDADTTLSGLLAGGTKIKWAGGLRKRLEIEPAMCPILVMGPDSAEVPGLMAGTRALSSGHDHRSEWRLRLVFHVYTAGQDVDECEELLFRVVAVLADQFAFGLADNGLYAMDFPQTEFEPQPLPAAKTIIWRGVLVALARYCAGTP